MAFDIKEYYKNLVIEKGKSVHPDLEWISKGLAQGRDAVKEAKISLTDQASVLDSLAGLVRDDKSLANFANTAGNISGKMKRHKDLVPMSNAIDQVVVNITEDYDTYSTAMDQGASFIDSIDFLEDADDWVDLNESVKNIPIEGYEIKGGVVNPKYESTGQYLTAMNNQINSLAGRVGNASKNTQFRYNKNAKYQDHEIKEKLALFQKKLAVAVQAAQTDGVITLPEAQYIMMGDLDFYTEERDRNIKDIGRQIDKTDSTIKQLQNQRIKLKDSLGGDFLPMFNDIQQAIDIETQDSKAAEGVDTKLKATSEIGLDAELENMIERFMGVRDIYLKSHEFHAGSPKYQGVVGSKSEYEDLISSITEERVGADPLEVQRLIPELGGEGVQGKLPGEIVEGRLIPDKGTVAERAERRVEAEELAKTEIPELTTPVGDVSEEGISPSDWKNTAATVVGFGALTQMDRIEQGIKHTTKFIAQGSRYIHSATNLSAPQISKFLGHSSTQATLDHIAKEEAKIASLKEEGKVGSKAYTDAKAKIKQIIKNRSNYWAKEFDVDKKHIDRLWQTKEGRGKWSRIFQLKSDIKNKYPKLFKQIYEGKKLPKTVGAVKTVGKLGRAYVPWKMGEIVADAIGAEGIKGLGVQATTAGGVTYATQKFWPKALSMAKSPAGKEALKKIFGKTIGTKVIQGAVAGKHPAISTLLGTAGAVWGAIDMYNAIKDWSE